LRLRSEDESGEQGCCDGGRALCTIVRIGLKDAGTGEENKAEYFKKIRPSEFGSRLQFSSVATTFGEATGRDGWAQKGGK